MPGLLPDQPQGHGLLQRFFANGGLAGLLGMQPLAQRMVDESQAWNAQAKAAGVAPPPAAPWSPEATELADIAGAFDFTGAIKAYHGSPHTFDRFDLSKIGTGEGAQAYGHGLYFAENPAVANQYQRNLANVTLDDKPVIELASQKHRLGIKDSPTAEQDIADYVSSYDGIKNARHTIANRRPELLKVFDEMVEGGRLKETGNTYAVNLDVNHEDLLDWDAPLSQQPEKVRKALGEASLGGREISVNSPMPGTWYARDASSSDIVGKIDQHPGGFTLQAFGKDKGGEFKSLEEAQAALSGNTSGVGLYQSLSERMGGPDKAAAALRAAGIPGIRYLDQGSRGKGEGSHNFVMFDDQLAEILERNGQPVKP